MPRTISPSFKAKRITRSYEQAINAAPSKVFDLLCPVKEAELLSGNRGQIGPILIKGDSTNNFLTAEAQRTQRLSFICLIFLEGEIRQNHHFLCVLCVSSEAGGEFASNRSLSCNGQHKPPTLIVVEVNNKKECPEP